MNKNIYPNHFDSGALNRVYDKLITQLQLVDFLLESPDAFVYAELWQDMANLYPADHYINQVNQAYGDCKMLFEDHLELNQIALAQYVLTDEAMAQQSLDQAQLQHYRAALLNAHQRLNPSLIESIFTRKGSALNNLLNVLAKVYPEISAKRIRELMSNEPQQKTLDAAVSSSTNELYDFVIDLPTQSITHFVDAPKSTKQSAESSVQATMMDSHHTQSSDLSEEIEKISTRARIPSCRIKDADDNHHATLSDASEEVEKISARARIPSCRIKDADDNHHATLSDASEEVEKISARARIPSCRIRTSSEAIEKITTDTSTLSFHSESSSEEITTVVTARDPIDLAIEAKYDSLCQSIDTLTARREVGVKSLSEAQRTFKPFRLLAAVLPPFKLTDAYQTAEKRVTNFEAKLRLVSEGVIEGLQVGPALINIIEDKDRQLNSKANFNAKYKNIPLIQFEVYTHVSWQAKLSKWANNALQSVAEGAIKLKNSLLGFTATLAERSTAKAPTTTDKQVPGTSTEVLIATLAIPNAKVSRSADRYDNQSIAFEIDQVAHHVRDQALELSHTVQQPPSPRVSFDSNQTSKALLELLEEVLTENNDYPGTMFGHNSPTEAKESEQKLHMSPQSMVKAY